MPIQGPLRELGIHDVFQLLDLSRKTGVLSVRSELRQNEGVIWFESGAVVAASIRSNPHRLGDLLFHAGKVGEEDLLRAREMQEKGDTRRMGEILVGIGALSQRDLEAHVRAQVEEVVFTVLGWSEGYFVFEEGAAGDIPRDANVRISTEALLMEGARRIDEWERIQSRIPHLGVVPRLAAAEDESAGTLNLTPFEWRVLAGCDGRFDVRALAQTLAASEFDVARTLFGLESAGVIVLSDPAAETARAAPRRDAGALLAEGEEYLRRGDPAAARTVAEAVIVAFPRDARGHALLGRSLVLEGRQVEAEAPLREAVRLEPNAARPRRLLGYARLSQGRLADATQAWEEWLALPDRPADEDRHLATVMRHVEAARVLADGIRGLS